MRKIIAFILLVCTLLSVTVFSASGTVIPIYPEGFYELGEVGNGIKVYRYDSDVPHGAIGTDYIGDYSYCIRGYSHFISFERDNHAFKHMIYSYSAKLTNDDLAEISELLGRDKLVLSGDVNGDNKVNLCDIIALKNVIFEGEYSLAGDLTENIFTNNLSDIIALRGLIMRK